LDRNTSDVWRPSGYNLFAPIPGSSRYAGINLVSGCCKSFTRTELCLLSEAEFFLVPLGVEINPRFNRGKIKKL